ncbi:RNA polymerase sigma factor [Corallococcus sp. CA053C]|uniref:RNA polymerase sigma factor n=1 Tax=Corallococcus sp. CA053C TaxID=2316732 RepID=UPI000EA24F15|nr:RNA polymerase sigma factor [Corallococcus sp. CA053C]RKH11592.1 RNA polymerase sigma factor [Corallococcus sp. CA053C]
MKSRDDNPFHAGYDTDGDRGLVERAVDGSKDALRELVSRHQPFVYNLALKMCGRREDAEDLTQEVFVKVITSLRTFRAESAFRTWLYRLTVNHLLKSRRRGMEVLVDDFETYFSAIAAVPDEALTPQELRDAGRSVEELRIRCTTGMLMCLDREQRITYVLGELFGVDHQLGGEILEISPGNFRVRLSRARKDLYSWMNQRCGLVNLANPCRCHKKTRSYVRSGAVDPEHLVFNTDYVDRIEALTRSESSEVIDTVEQLHQRVFLEHPLQVSRSKVVDEVLQNDTLRTFFGI